MIKLTYYCQTSVGNSSCADVQEGSVRLMDGMSLYEGRVEVCSGGQWGTICNRYWDYQEASVVCRQLGFASVGNLLCLTYEWFSDPYM